MNQILKFQTQKKGQPLAEVPVGSCVAFYQFSKGSSPKWDSRGWVVSNIQTNEISPIQYVIQLERGHKKGLWKPTSKHFGEMVSRSRQHILPIRLKTSACFDLLTLILSSCHFPLCNQWQIETTVLSMRHIVLKQWIHGHR